MVFFKWIGLYRRERDAAVWWHCGAPRPPTCGSGSPSASIAAQEGSFWVVVASGGRSTPPNGCPVTLEMALCASTNRDGFRSRNRTARRRLKRCAVISNISEAQVLTPNSHGEQAVRVSPVSQGGHMGALGTFGIPTCRAGAFRRRMPQPTLTPLVLRGYLELGRGPRICWPSRPNASGSSGAL